MTTDRRFTHPDFGKLVRIEMQGCEVRLVFVASSMEKAEDLAEDILRQLENGAISITMVGKPTGITEKYDA